MGARGQHAAAARTGVTLVLQIDEPGRGKHAIEARLDWTFGVIHVAEYVGAHAHTHAWA